MAGHVFVVPGSLERLDCDDLVVPTDHGLNVTDLWTDVLGWRGDPDRRRADLSSVGALTDDRPFAQLPDDGQRRRWLLSVGNTRGDVGRLVQGLSRCLEAIAGEARRGPGRLLQRIALPTVGVARGGFADQRGAVIEALVRAAREMAERRDIDVVFVAFDPADYSAFQSVRRRLGVTPLTPALTVAADALAGLVREGQLALFMGAGTGISAGLPSWDGLLKALATEVGLAYAKKQWRELGALDAGELLRRKAQVTYPDQENPLGRLVAEQIRPVQRYALSHVLLASLGCEHVITTNFDRLYEDAVRAIGQRRPVVVLPHTEERELNRTGTRGWLLKLHGDVAKEASIVLDRRSFVTYDARRRPLGGVLQTTLLTKHLLVVGASMTDDNVIRLVHEVAELVETSGTKTPQLGTVLTLGGDNLRAQLWAPEFSYLDLTEGGDVPQGARNLEIFLDHVAMQATGSNQHLLSEAYGALLGDEQRDLARRIREVALDIAAQPGPQWQALSAALAEFGAPGPNQRP